MERQLFNGTGHCLGSGLYFLNKKWQSWSNVTLIAIMASFMTISSLFGLGVVDALASGQSRRVVTDTNSGYALFGYDPVAYFTEHSAIRGKRQNEFVWRGVSWTFTTKANREVFKADPEIYAPQYGGHGALAVARGYAADCNPNVWAIYDRRLFLFYSYTARAAWAEAVDLHVQRADKQWAQIEGTLSR